MRLLTIPELAELLKVKVSYVYMLNHTGEGPPALKLGRKTVRYQEEDVMAWLKSRRNGEEKGRP